MRNFVTIVALLVAMSLQGQGVVSLDSCRSMALHNNKEMRLAELSIDKAGYQRREAHAAYFPSIDLEGLYTYTSRKLALVEEDQLLPVKTFDLASQSYQFNVVKNPVTGEPIMNGNTPIPTQVALLPKSALTYNIHNVMGGALTLTQPIFMGGKIKAMNAITGYAEELARVMRDNKAQDIIYEVDAAYWQVVSLRAKQELAQSYVELVEALDRDVKDMMEQGVATRASVLTVDVKLNEAQVDLTRVNNGLVLARMLLAQVCGLPVNTIFTLADENDEDWQHRIVNNEPSFADMNAVYASRNDVQALTLATKIYDQKALVARSEMLPKVAAIAAYHLTNPNTYNGFKNRFGGAFSVGVTLKVPIWHWGGPTAKYKAAQVEARMKQVELDDAKEKIALQVSQAQFRIDEARKTLAMTEANLAKAEENLRVANVAFHEGVSTTDDVMAAQTAWLKANSERVDAAIDLQLCNVYLSKVTGQLRY